MSESKWPPDALEIRGEGLEQFSKADLRDLRRFLGRRALGVEPIYDPEPKIVPLEPDYIEEIEDKEEWFIGRPTFRRAGESAGHNAQFVSTTFSKLLRIARPGGSVLKSKDKEKDEEQLSLDIGRNVDKIRVILPREIPELEQEPNDALLSVHGLCAALMDGSLQTTAHKPNGIGGKSLTLIEDVVQQFLLPEHRQ